MYPYKWSINLGINPIHLFWIKVWIGNTNWFWKLKQPLAIKRQDE